MGTGRHEAKGGVMVVTLICGCAPMQMQCWAVQQMP
jgi:hypothetical protein